MPSGIPHGPPFSDTESVQGPRLGPFSCCFKGFGGASRRSETECLKQHGSPWKGCARSLCGVRSTRHSAANLPLTVSPPGATMPPRHPRRSPRVLHRGTHAPAARTSVKQGRAVTLALLWRGKPLRGAASKCSVPNGHDRLRRRVPRRRLKVEPPEHL